MPLKIRIKPEGKIYAGGAVLKNVGKKPADLLVLSEGPVLREAMMMNPDKKDSSDAASVYFILQLLYLFKGKGQPMDHLVMDTLVNFARLYPQFAERIDEIRQHLQAGETFKALKIGHELMGIDAKPIDAEVLKEMGIKLPHEMEHNNKPETPAREENAAGA